MGREPLEDLIVYAGKVDAVQVKPRREVPTAPAVRRDRAGGITLFGEVRGELAHTATPFVRRHRIMDTPGLFKEVNEPDDARTEGARRHVPMLITLAMWAWAGAVMGEESPHNPDIHRADRHGFEVRPDQEVLRRSGEVLNTAFGHSSLPQMIQKLHDEGPIPLIDLDRRHRRFLLNHLHAPFVVRRQDHADYGESGLRNFLI
ncbi:hypothetical protein L284_21250 [Novosphingobium lindaniclasticum LE124]|uniref:Uncharacterized protein n=1 Tax=Novosphingobium lindaniclasticum LE124 TaxID=1096930 RepID=T0I9Q4_9SPHN|nr:hypothetical protein L284_21250 [Novosphingobium lindaniclasticum LE124]